MPAITREYVPNQDPMKVTLRKDRKKAIKARIIEIIKEIKTYIGNNDPVIGYWRRELWDEIEYLRLNKYKKDYKSGISDADIERAKQYPINKIINFNNGVATAWCHADKNPSLTYWEDKNLAYCFVCQKAIDPIQAFMELQDMSFTETIKTLR